MSLIHLNFYINDHGLKDACESISSSAQKVKRSIQTNVDVQEIDYIDETFKALNLGELYNIPGFSHAIYALRNQVHNIKDISSTRDQIDVELLEFTIDKLIEISDSISELFTQKELGSVMEQYQDDLRNFILEKAYSH